MSDTSKIYTLDHIAKIISDYYSIPIKILVETKDVRKREFVDIRNMIMAKQRKFTRCSNETIGIHLFDKDHATVSHALKTIKNLEFSNSVIRNRSKEIDQLIENKIIGIPIIPNYLNV